MKKPPRLPYEIDEEKKQHFARLYLLDYLIKNESGISILLDEHHEALEPLLDQLMARELISINDRQNYVVSPQGKALHHNFLKHYRENVAVNDIFCAVDLESGEFAFSYYDDYPEPRQWQNFLGEERWDDLRVAVCEFLDEDPVEMVYMSFINENRFGRDQQGKWQFDLLLGSIWDEIIEICNQAIHWPDLGYEDEQGKVPAEAVIEDIISQGRELLGKL